MKNIILAAFVSAATPAPHDLQCQLVKNVGLPECVEQRSREFETRRGLVYRWGSPIAEQLRQARTPGHE